jgi:hypothetical protein
MIQEKPIVGKTYQHNNGMTYEVLFIANENSTNEEYPETVVYQGLNGKVWTKTVENFKLKMNDYVL